MICSKCSLEKQIHEMRKGKKICKACTNSRFMLWKQSSGFIDYQKEHCKANYEKNKPKRDEYTKTMRTKLNARFVERYNTDLNFKLSQNLRNRISYSIKSGSAIKDLGCSIDELKLYLESKFQEGMSWTNHGKWHIDHIRPLCSFDLTNREQFIQACHFSNLQPLWAVDNIRKGGKLVGVDIIVPDGDLR